MTPHPIYRTVENTMPLTETFWTRLKLLVSRYDKVDKKNESNLNGEESIASSTFEINLMTSSINQVD